MRLSWDRILVCVLFFTVIIHYLIAKNIEQGLRPAPNDFNEYKVGVSEEGLGNASFGILFVSFLDKKHEKTTEEPPREPEKTTTKEQEQPKTGKAKSNRRPVKDIQQDKSKARKEKQQR